MSNQHGPCTLSLIILLFERHRTVPYHIVSYGTVPRRTVPCYIILDYIESFINNNIQNVLTYGTRPYGTVLIKDYNSIYYCVSAYSNTRSAYRMFQRL